MGDSMRRYCLSRMNVFMDRHHSRSANCALEPFKVCSDSDAGVGEVPSTVRDVAHCVANNDRMRSCWCTEWGFGKSHTAAPATIRDHAASRTTLRGFCTWHNAHHDSVQSLNSTVHAIQDCSASVACTPLVVSWSLVL